MLAGTFDKRDAGSRAAHVGKEADKADDGLEIAQLEDATAGDEHLVVAPVRGNGPDDPGAVPTVVALLGPFLADHLDEVAVSKEAAQSVFCNHIRGFFYHGLPLGPFLPEVQSRAHGVATPRAIQDNMNDSKTIKTT